MTDSKEFYSTVPVSNPVVVPEAEEVQMNGFAWSATFGLMLALADTGQPAVDELDRLRNPVDSYELTKQGLRDEE